MKSAVQGGNVHIVLVCLLANNFTMGLTYGSFGALMASNEQLFGVTRDMIALGMSAVTTATGLSALFMGGLVQKLTPRVALALGVAVAGCAFAGLGVVTNLWMAYAMWVLLGFGMAMAAILAPVTIVAQHFPERSGRILGLVNLPIMLFATPWVVALNLPSIGRTGIYLFMAAMLVPVFLAALSLPRAKPGERGAGHHQAGGMKASAMLKRTDFWLITLGIAVIAGTGVAFTVHAIPYATSRGLPTATAALMLSIYSGAGLAGVPLFGWLADKLGPPSALALSAVLQCGCWFGLAVLPTSTFLPLAALLGLATTPLVALHGTAMARLFGANSVSTAMGISFGVKLPFLFLVSPIVAYVFVHMGGDYRPAFIGVSSTLLAASCLLIAAVMAVTMRNAAKARISAGQPVQDASSAEAS